MNDPLSGQRRRIDAVDEQILDLLTERQELLAEVEKAKAPRIAISTGKKAEGGEAP